MVHAFLGEDAAGSACQVGEPFPLSTLRHSVSHLMASAVQRLYPGVSLGFGPAIEHGFYYELDLPTKLVEQDLAATERKLRRIAKQAPQIVREEVTRAEARKRLSAKSQGYKLEALDLIPDGEAITVYRHGDWEALCEGPHVDRLDRDFHFKLLSPSSS